MVAVDRSVAHASSESSGYKKLVAAILEHAVNDLGYLAERRSALVFFYGSSNFDWMSRLIGIEPEIFQERIELRLIGERLPDGLPKLEFFLAWHALDALARKVRPSTPAALLFYASAQEALEHFTHPAYPPERVAALALGSASRPLPRVHGPGRPRAQEVAEDA